MSKQTRVKIKEQWRDFNSQASAREWARRLLDAEVTFLEVTGGDD